MGRTPYVRTTFFARPDCHGILAAYRIRDKGSLKKPIGENRSHTRPVCDLHGGIGETTELTKLRLQVVSNQLHGRKVGTAYGYYNERESDRK